MAQIMCVGCGVMMDRDDVSGYFLSASGVRFPMCPACASRNQSMAAASSNTPQTPGVMALSQQTQTFKSVNRLRREKLAGMVEVSLEDKK